MSKVVVVWMLNWVRVGLGRGKRRVDNLGNSGVLVF